MFRKKFILGGMLILLAIGLPAVIFLSQQTQETRSRASASTTLSFQPSNTPESPLQRNVGDSVSFDVYVAPGGSNLVSQVKLEISYDPTKLTPTNSPFTINTLAFPGLLDGPVLQNDKIALTVVTGGDFSKALTQVTKVGTVNFTAISSTSVPTQLSFSSGTQILSFAAEDMSNENILSTSTPTFVTINESTANQLSISPSPEPQGTRLDMKIFLGGTDKNAKPQSLTRDFDIQMFNNQNQLVASPRGALTYNATTGNFTGVISVKENIPTGIYLIKIKSSGYLTKIAAGNQAITSGQANALPSITLVAGDINGDNILNTADYNLIQGCFGTTKPATCTSQILKVADLNNDGIVDIIDLNIFLREFSTKSGD